MISNNSSFQLFNDENATISMNPMLSSSSSAATSSTIIKKRLGFGNNNNINSNNNNIDNDTISATPSKVLSGFPSTANKSNRKALVDLTHSQVNTRATPGRPLLQQHHQQGGQGLKKLVFKNDTNNPLNNNSSIIINNSNKIDIEPDIPIDEMICSRMNKNVDEDPYDKVQRMSSKFKFTLKPTLDFDKTESLFDFDMPQELTKEELLLLNDDNDPFKDFNIELPCKNDNIDFLLE